MVSPPDRAWVSPSHLRSRHPARYNPWETHDWPLPRYAGLAVRAPTPRPPPPVHKRRQPLVLVTFPQADAGLPPGLGRDLMLIHEQRANRPLYLPLAHTVPRPECGPHFTGAVMQREPAGNRSLTHDRRLPGLRSGSPRDCHRFHDGSPPQHSLQRQNGSILVTQVTPGNG